ncbi:MAG: tetratricopeptide repeat protein [Gemmatimonadaceae bacterium]|jgi:tetratricopeptide (TPR) repeat protein|nr:tetratricopeptide repeat protein [Gemmatimonadaceae bacterium]
MNTPHGAPVLTAREGDRLRAVVARVPASHANALNSAAVVLARRGLPIDAALAFERALDADPRHATALENLRRLAQTGTLDRDRVAALAARVAADVDDVDAALALGRWHARLGRPAEARPVLLALVRRRPDQLAALRELAIVEQACGDTAAAVAWLERAIAVAADEPALHVQLGELCYRSGRPEAARTALERAVALAPDHAWAHHMLAFVLGDLGEPGPARDAAHRALALDPTLARVEPALTLEPRRARGLANPARTGQGAGAAHLQLALAYRNAGFHEQALASLMAARSAGAPVADVAGATIAVHVQRGDWAAALAVCDEQLVQAPRDVAAHASRAALLLRIGDAGAACAAAADALALDPAHGAALLAHAVACALLGDTAVALATAQRARGSARLEAAARANAAWLLRQIGRAAPALEGFRRVTETQPQNVRAWIGMGVALMDLRRPAEALAALEQAVALDTGGGDAAHHLALALTQCGRWQDGMVAMQRAIAADVDFAPFRYEVVLDPDVPDVVLEIPAGELRPLHDAEALLREAERTPGPVAAVQAEARRAAFTGGVRAVAAATTPHGAWVALRRGATPPAPRTPTGAMRPVEVVRGTPALGGVGRASSAPRAGIGAPIEDETALRARLARDPDVAATRVALARLLAADGRVVEAEAQLRCALELVPTWREAARTLAELLVDAERADEALDVLARPVRADPDDAGLLVATSEALLALGRDTQAVTALARAARLAPEHAGVRTLRGWLALRDGRPVEAQAHWQVAASQPVDMRWVARARRALAEHEGASDVAALALEQFTGGAG